jgi:hypothetical protein
MADERMDRQIVRAFWDTCGEGVTAFKPGFDPVRSLSALGQDWPFRLGQPNGCFAPKAAVRLSADVVSAHLEFGQVPKFSKLAAVSSRAEGLLLVGGAGWSKTRQLSKRPGNSIGIIRSCFITSRFQKKYCAEHIASLLMVAAVRQFVRHP